MAKKIIKKAQLTKKKKKWYEIVAPVELKSVALMETLTSDPKLLAGRVIKMNMMTITRDIKKQNIIIAMTVKEVKEGKALTDFTGYEITSANVKRLVKRSKAKIEDSFKCKTNDGHEVIVKPLLLLRKNVQRNVLSSLRMTTRAFITKIAAEKKYSEFLQMILSLELQKKIKEVTKQIYPVGMVEIRVMKKVK